jgi:hypothetical protein
VEQPFAPSPSPHELLGHAVHHALRARFSIERGRYWHAEYWISSLRDCALALACRRRDLPAVYGRGFDDLPAGVRAAFERALVSKLEREELMSALGCAIDGLLREVDEVRDLAARVEPQLRELMAALDS